MSVREKYVLYQMIYMKVGERNAFLARRRQAGKFILPWHVRKAAMDRTNFVLSAIGETFTLGELIVIERS